ncbi:ParB family protein [Vibrio marisflavi]|uniref:ParB protein family C-terminal domain-containing protein n=1 Tax=Vibrio marisflavi CECT 7928 TaxID=634439 RepID=A0ABN8E9R8_9VIBR|nr:ParB family protein [Vibrio marisflavi]CAH0543299.1 hypothetical protein VMF7928_04509 [Vibrio marisflavi CECT 7928]
MNSKYSRSTGKEAFLGKSAKGHLQQGNKLQVQSKRELKEYKLESGVYKAQRHVLSHDEIETKTRSHFLNPRNQDALNYDAASAIIESIREKGIDTDCLGIWSSDNTTILVIEGSLRRYCAIETKQSYPIWVLPSDSASNNDIRALIRDAHSLKPHSLRERGKAMMDEAGEHGIEPSTLTVNELAALLNVGRETVRKSIQALKIDEELLQIFPDYEGIPNSFYAKLARVEKTLKKFGTSIQSFKDAILMDKDISSSSQLDKAERQDIVLSVIERQELALKGSGSAKSETLVDLVKFASKDKHARKRVSANGKTVKFELSRMDKALVEEVEALIKSYCS